MRYVTLDLTVQQLVLRKRGNEKGNCDFSRVALSCLPSGQSNASRVIAHVLSLSLVQTDLILLFHFVLHIALQVEVTFSAD